MIEAKIRAILAATTAVTTMVSTRIYAGILPQNPTYPAITIQPITYDSSNTLKGSGNLQWDRLQIDAWGETYASTDGVYKAVITALNGKQFTGTGYRIGSCNVQAGGRYRYEDSTKIHGRSVDFGIWFNLS